MPAGHVVIKWNSDEAEAFIRDRIADRLDAAGKAEVENIQQLVGKPGPPHSEPGESPRKISGDFQSSIYSEVRLEGTEVKLIVGSTSSYAVALELGTQKMRPRPVLLPAIYRISQRLNGSAGNN